MSYLHLKSIPCSIFPICLKNAFWPLGCSNTNQNHASCLGLFFSQISCSLTVSLPVSPTPTPLLCQRNWVLPLAWATFWTWLIASSWWCLACTAVPSISWRIITEPEESLYPDSIFNFRCAIASHHGAWDV